MIVAETIAYPSRYSETLMNSPTPDRGLFIGLVTLDLIYQVEQFPYPNQKLVASDYRATAGGPATNAAVTFAHFGNAATLLGVVGTHPLTTLIRADLNAQGVEIADLEPQRSEAPPTSSIWVTRPTGERAVVSLNAVHCQANFSAIPPAILQDVKIVLIDGHQLAVSTLIAGHAQAQGIPVAIDGGSWKPGFEQVLPFVDYAICSEHFSPPGCSDSASVVAYLHQFGINQIAITHGEQPIEYWDDRQSGQIAVPTVLVVDTLGAGDIFHGAFCQFIQQHDFGDALVLASEIAAQSCQYLGTRSWMQR